MKKYIPIPGVKPQMLTDFGTLNGLLDGAFSRENLVQTDGKRLKVLNVGKKSKILYFIYDSPYDLENGIIATSYDGSYIGLPIKTFKPEYQKQIMEQLR